MARNPQVDLPKRPADGWGSVEGIVHIFGEGWSMPATLETLACLNKTGGSRQGTGVYGQKSIILML